MKYSLSARQDRVYLEKADEIKFEYRDIAVISEYAEKYPKAALVVEVLPAQEWDVDKVKEAFVLSRERLTVCVPKINDPKVDELRQKDIPYYCGYAASTAWELRAMVRTGVSQVKVDGPLFFQQDLLKKFPEIQFRVVANVAHEGYLPFDGVCGSWIRPEDVGMYEDTISTIEFADCDRKKEQSLFRIYAQHHEWPGKISMLFTNVGAECTNRLLPPDFTKARLNCGQKCQVDSPCHLCYRHFALADEELIRSYKEEVLDKKEQIDLN